jgi:uncharacterized phiE125 gp8 family phage protein
MTLSLLNGPLAEPVDLADAKLHLRVDHADEDDLINGLIAAARLHIEANASLAMVHQTWKWISTLSRRDKSSARLSFPLGPLASIVEVTIDGRPLSPSEFSFSNGLNATLALNNVSVVSGEDIEITFVAGFGPIGGNVPRDLRHAVTLLVTQWFEHREPGGIGDAGLPPAVAALLAPYRRLKL